METKDRRRFSLSQEETRARVEASLPRRYRKEKLFHFYGLVSVLFGIGFLFFLFWSIVSNGYSAFWQTYVLA